MQLNVGKEIAAMEQMVVGHTTRQNKRCRYYVCNNAQKRVRHDCSGASLSANKIDQLSIL